MNFQEYCDLLLALLFAASAGYLFLDYKNNNDQNNRP
jgi:hypothetical protein